MTLQTLKPPVPWRHRAALQRTRLGAINAGPGGDHARHNTIAIRHYADLWRVGGRHVET